MIFIAASWLLALGGTWLGWWVGLAYTMQTAPQGLAPSNMALALALPVGSLLTGAAALYQYWGTDAAWWWRFTLLAPPMLLSGAIIALFASEGCKRSEFRTGGSKPRPRRPLRNN